MSDSIVLCNATKVISGRTVLDDVSLELGRTGVYGFSGVNGSGKTMLLRAVSGLIRLTSGYVEVFGKRVGEDVDFPPKMGLAFESSGFWGEHTGRKNLRLLASIRGVASDQDVDAALCRTGLDPDDTRPFSAYSLGMRQRLLLAQAVMEEPDLLVMDEPTNSLDADGVRMVASLVREERERGATVMVASHNDPLLEELYDRSFHVAAGRVMEGGGAR